jgi:hypothetical protein
MFNVTITNETHWKRLYVIVFQEFYHEKNVMWNSQQITVHNYVNTVYRTYTLNCEISLYEVIVPAILILAFGRI